MGGGWQLFPTEFGKLCVLLKKSWLRPCCLLNFGEIAEHHGKVGYNTVKHTTVFLHSDWLYFLWYCIKSYLCNVCNEELKYEVLT